MNTKTNVPVKLMLCVFVICLCRLKIRTCHAADAITAEQSLSGDETIVSAGGDFELGFFQPGSSSNYYIGIWYRIFRNVNIVWVANREKPVSNIYSSVLKISVDGNLVLFDEFNTSVWSTSLTSTTTSGTSVQALLLDNGNFVLRAVSNLSQPLWQSFDHPTHTWLPGSRIGFNKVTNQTQILTSWKSSEDPAPGLYSMELDPNGTTSCIMLWNRSKQYWTSGFWDEKSRTFSLVPHMRPNYMYNFSYVTNKNESYFTFSALDPKYVSRTVMDISGQVNLLTWVRASTQWNLFWSQPRQICEVYALCGAFGICGESSLPYCNCLMGFQPKSPSEWDSQVYAGGCSRITSFQCGNAASVDRERDRFAEMPNVSLPANDQSVRAGSIRECESICLNDCSCTAYAYGTSIGCAIWRGDLLDMAQLPAKDGDGETLYIKLAASEFNKLQGGKSHADKRSLIIAIVSATAGLILTVIVSYISWKKIKERKHKKKYGETINNIGGKNDAELTLFSIKSIIAATNNFSEENKLGEGGFGPVYKGILTEHQEVAIKRLSKKSGQGHQEFMNELKLIAKLQHTNLVRLLGCCIEDDEMILIYEYMPNRSLDKFLFDPSENIKLDWGKRFRIIEGIAQGVLYIHKHSRLKIIHRDLKASNVLLDEEMNPKISDFGMAKIFEVNQTEANTNRVVGTYGYMSPEYARYGHFSEKLDVFSFGVLLLEIISGKRNGAFYHFEHSPTLAGWAWNLWKEGRGMEVIDESLRETCLSDEAFRCIHVAFLCVQESPADRPTMSSVIKMLQANESTSLPSSKEPAFSTHSNSSVVASSPISIKLSNNELTVSTPVGR